MRCIASRAEQHGSTAGGGADPALIDRSLPTG